MSLASLQKNELDALAASTGEKPSLASLWGHLISRMPVEPEMLTKPSGLHARHGSLELMISLEFSTSAPVCPCNLRCSRYCFFASASCVESHLVASVEKDFPYSKRLHQIPNRSGGPSLCYPAKIGGCQA